MNGIPNILKMRIQHARDCLIEQFVVLDCDKRDRNPATVDMKLKVLHSTVNM